MTNRCETICDICGKRFVRYTSSQKRCSEECMKKGTQIQKKKYMSKWNKEHPKVYPARQIVCIKCGVAFMGRSNQKICEKCLVTRKDCKKYLDARSENMNVGEKEKRDG